MLPDFKEDPYDLGSFDEIVHHRGGRGGRAETFETGFDAAPKVDLNGQPYRFRVTFGKTGTAPIPTGTRLTRAAVWIEVLLNENRPYQISFGTSRGAWKVNTSDIFPARLDSYDNRIPIFLDNF